MPRQPIKSGQSKGLPVGATKAALLLLLLLLPTNFTSSTCGNSLRVVYIAGAQRTAPGVCLFIVYYYFRRFRVVVACCGWSVSPPSTRPHTTLSNCGFCCCYIALALLLQLPLPQSLQCGAEIARVLAQIDSNDRQIS